MLKASNRAPQPIFPNILRELESVYFAMGIRATTSHNQQQPVLHGDLASSFENWKVHLDQGYAYGNHNFTVLHVRGRP
jgi:hypothetical protein